MSIVAEVCDFMKILAFGEILWDVYPDEKFIGGASFNFAAHAAMQGADVYLASSVGDDELGKEALQYTKKYNINQDYISLNKDKETGKCIVSLDENKIPSYEIVEDVAYDYINVPAKEEFHVLYFGTLAIRGEHNMNEIKKLIESGICKNIFVDVNVRKPFCSPQSVMLALNNADYIKISDEELSYISDSALGEGSGDIYEAVRTIGNKFKNLKLVILTMGETGAYVFDCKENREYLCQAHKTDVISTVGAGDSFSASFLTEFLKTGDIKSSLNTATKVSSFVVSKREAVPQYNIADLM